MSYRTLQQYASSFIVDMPEAATSRASAAASESESESEMHVMSMESPIVLTSINAPHAREYLIGHNRPRALSQTSRTKQLSDILAKSTA